MSEHRSGRQPSYYMNSEGFVSNDAISNMDNLQANWYIHNDPQTINTKRQTSMFDLTYDNKTKDIHEKDNRDLRLSIIPERATAHAIAMPFMFIPIFNESRKILCITEDSTVTTSIQDSKGQNNSTIEHKGIQVSLDKEKILSHKYEFKEVIRDDDKLLDGVRKIDHQQVKFNDVSPPNLALYFLNGKNQKTGDSITGIQAHVMAISTPIQGLYWAKIKDARDVKAYITVRGPINNRHNTIITGDRLKHVMSIKKTYSKRRKKYEDVGEITIAPITPNSICSKVIDLHHIHNPDQDELVTFKTDRKNIVVYIKYKELTQIFPMPINKHNLKIFNEIELTHGIIKLKNNKANSSVYLLSDNEKLIQAIVEIYLCNKNKNKCFLITTGELVRLSVNPNNSDNAHEH